MAKQSFIDHCVGLVKNIVLGDADASKGGLFLARQLTSVKSKSYDQKYANLKAKELFPVSHEHPAGTETIAIPSYDGAAIVKQINDYATDLPKAEITGKETLVKINNYGNAYEYTNRELRRAQMAGLALQQRKANVASRAHEEKFNNMAFFGDGDSTYGLFTYPGIPTSTAPDGTGGDPEWSTKTPAEILLDMNSAVTTIVDTTKMVEQPNTMLLPVEQYRLVKTTARSNESDKTILEYFLDNNPGITVIPVNELAGAGTGGVDVMVVYDRSPDTVQLEIPLEPVHEAPQMKGLGYEIPIESECGGLSIYYPLAFNIVESI